MLESRRAELARFCYESHGTLTGQNYVALLEVLLDEARRKNDDTRGEDVAMCQGEIRAYKTLLQMFQRKPPT